MSDLGTQGGHGAPYVAKPCEGGNYGQPARPDVQVDDTSTRLASAPAGTGSNDGNKPR